MDGYMNFVVQLQKIKLRAHIPVLECWTFVDEHNILERDQIYDIIRQSGSLSFNP